MGRKINIQGVKRSPGIPQIMQCVEVNQDSGSHACLNKPLELYEKSEKIKLLF